MMPVHQQPIAHVVILLSRHNTEYLEYWVAQDKKTMRSVLSDIFRGTIAIHLFISDSHQLIRKNFAI